MRNLASLIALPASLIPSLLVSSAYSQEWPYNLPADAKYYPEHEVHIKRNLEIQQRLSTASPLGVQKLSDDEGEKFFMEYWQFDEPASGSPETENTLQLRRSLDATQLPSNLSVSEELLPPLVLHADLQHAPYLHRVFGRSLFERSFNCPTGTDSCKSIGQSDSCCATGETCISLSASSGASVGCCPSGASCGGQVGSCNTAAGYSSCSNGGCCIHGYTCQGVGCVYASTRTTTTTLPTVTVTTGASWSTLTDSTTTETFVVTAGSSSPSASSSASQPTSIRTVTTTLVIAPSAGTETTTVVQTTTLTPSSSAVPTSTSSPTTTSSSTTSGQGPLTCSSGFRTCPASLGGGCCPTDRACGSVSCPASSSTATAVPPVLPTSGSDSASVSTTESEASSSPTSTVTYSGCPTGFYMCSAYYMGGCCRVGRNCDTTSCPASSSTAVVTGTGVTVEAPIGASSAALTGSCANGWFSCAASVGGGCCPSGYQCGASCTATTSGQSDVGKGAPSEAVKARFGGWVLLFLGIVSGAGMLFL